MQTGLSKSKSKTPTTVSTPETTAPKKAKITFFGHEVTLPSLPKFKNPFSNFSLVSFLTKLFGFQKTEPANENKPKTTEAKLILLTQQEPFESFKKTYDTALLQCENKIEGFSTKFKNIPEIDQENLKTVISICEFALVDNPQTLIDHQNYVLRHLTNEQKREKLPFEVIRDKYGVVVNALVDELYSKKLQ